MSKPCLLSLVALAAALLGAMTAAAAGKTTVYVGTYTGNGSQGIYRFDLDTQTGAVSKATLAAEATNPSFLAIDPSRRHLYAVGEVDTFEGKKGGGVSAFEINPENGKLTLLNSQTSGGAGPCHLVVDRAGKNVLVANYGGGSASVIPIGEGGKLGTPSCFVQHTGSSVNPDRQKEPHAHSINLDAANRFAFVADLGLDQVLVYRFDPEKGTITPNDPPFARTAPGAGPRHFAFTPDGQHAYVINELNSTVTGWTYDAERGVLREPNSITSLPRDFKGANYPADIHVHPSGKFLYGSNRGHDSIAAFGVDPTTGLLEARGHATRGIKSPRNFAVAPDGRHVLVASQDANTVLVFDVDPKDGTLSPTEHVVAVPKPVCLQFWTAPDGR